MAAVSVVPGADASMEESFMLADLSNVSQEESQRITAQTRAAVYWAGNKGVSSQQAKDLYQISHSPQPQQNPPPPPSPPTSSPTEQRGKTRLNPTNPPPVDAVGHTMDEARTASCRARNNPSARPITAPQPPAESSESNTRRNVATDAGDYWYRTSVAGRLALGPETSSTPPRSGSESQSQSQSQTRSKPQAAIQSPPESPPRTAGSGLVKQFSQLSTSETSQERATVLVATSSNEDNRPGTTQIVDYSSEHSTRTETTNPELRQIPSHLRRSVSRRSSSPSLGEYQRPRSPRSSPSLGGRRSSPSLGGSPRQVFSYINRGGGSSPGPLSSINPTQEQAGGSQAIGMDVEGDGQGDSLDTQGTAPTQIVTPEPEYVNATPVTSGPLHKESQPQQEVSGGTGEGTQPTQIVSPEEDMQDVEQAQARPPTPPPITPYRAGESSHAHQDNSHPPTTDFPVSPTRAFTTPLTHHKTNPYQLDRSRKSSFAPPKRSRPDAQAPIPQLNTGPTPLVPTPGRWDAATAEEEERALRSARKDARTASSMPPKTPSPRKRAAAAAAATGVGTHDVLTSSTPFVSGGATAARETPRLVRSPLSPRKAAADGLEDDDDGPLTELEDVHMSSPGQNPLVARRESSLPLEMGRQARLSAQKKTSPGLPQVDSETEDESEEEAIPQRKPGRGGAVPTARRGRGARGRGRGRVVSNTPRTPQEARAETTSPTVTSAGKKRPRTSGPKETSPAPAKRLKAQVAPTAVVSNLIGTRVLAWWSGGDYYFGVITGSESNDRYDISFDDGFSAKVLLSKLRQGGLRVGDRVRVNRNNKGAEHKGEAVVTGITRWVSELKVRVAMGATGKGARIEVESKNLIVQTKEVTKSWGDRMLAGEASTSSTTKRKVSVKSEKATSSASGTKLGGYAFVLTVKAEDVGILDTQLDGWKARLRAKIEGQGGVIVDEWDELFAVRGKSDASGWHSEGDWAVQYVGGDKWPSIRKVFLLSAKMGTTPKYMMALALGVPCLSYKWVDEYLQDDSLQWSEALLPRGWSECYQSDISQAVDLQLQSEPDMTKTLMDSQLIRRPFRGKSVLCVFKRAKKIQPDRTDKGRFFSRVACVMGAASVDLVPDHDVASQPLPRALNEYDFVVCENPVTLRHLRDTTDAACYSTEWVKQCIIMGRAMPMTEE